MKLLEYIALNVIFIISLTGMELIKITRAESFKKALEYYTTGYHPDTIVVCDIDDTVGILFGDPILTKDAYQVNNKMQPEAKIKLSAQTLEHLRKKHEEAIMVPFDENNTIAKVIQDLQTNGVCVIGLTSRSIQLKDVTLKELHVDLDIHFTQLSEKSINISGFSQDALFTQGILFCGNNAKGPTLNELFNQLHINPETIIFADDDECNLKSVCDTFHDKQVISLHMNLSTPLEEEEYRYEEKIRFGDEEIPRALIYPELLKKGWRRLSMDNLHLKMPEADSTSSDRSLSPTLVSPYSHLSHSARDFPDFPFDPNPDIFKK